MIAKVGIAAMAIRGVALLTKLRRLTDQHGVVYAAMGVVTIRAVVGDGGMFPQFRAAFFGVAGVTGFVNTRLV